MEDRLMKSFAWLTPVLAELTTTDADLSREERAALQEFIEGWGKEETAEFLRSLSSKYGESAGAAVEKALARHIAKDWTVIGAREAHPGTEIADFVRTLWEPLKDEGFEFSQDTKDGRTTFRVTKCPIAELAQATGLHQWLYHLACSTDFYSTPAFSSKIMFSRTKTLMEGHDCCNHTYRSVG